MNVEKVNYPKNQVKFPLGKIIKSSLIGGALACESYHLLLPKEVKAAIKNTKYGQDAFITKTFKAAEKTLNNINKNKTASLIKSKFSNITPQEVVNNAVKMYPEMAETAAKASKELAKTFVTATGIILVVNLISAGIAKSAFNKANKQN